MEISSVQQKENQKSINQKKENQKNSKQEDINIKGEPKNNISTAEIGIMCSPLNEFKNIDIDSNQEKNFKKNENYLKKIIGKFEQNLFSNINKDLANQINDIHSQIQNDNIIIAKKQKDINKIFSASNKNKIIKYSNEDYELKKKYKAMKDLKEEQKFLINQLNKIEENEALLSNEGFINLNNSSDCITKFDKSIKEKHIKLNNNKKSDIIERLKEIEFRMYQLLDTDKINSKLSRQEKLQKFDEIYERDKEIIAKKSKNYLKESENARKKWEDIKNNYKNIIKNKIEEKEKYDREKSAKIIEQIKKREKAVEQKIYDNKKNMIIHQRINI